MTKSEAPGTGEWKCPKCGAQVDERFDCCEVHEQTRRAPVGAWVTDAQIEHMVQQFLRWKLPDDFNPDGGISFDPIMNLGTEHQSRREPVGTNLFDYQQAKAMVHHMLEGLSAAIGAGGQAVALREAAEEFCRRVEAGEIRSKKSYAAFKSALSQPHPADERVALPPITDRGLAGQIIDAAWPEFGGELQTAEFWNDFGTGVEFTLKTLSQPHPADERVVETTPQAIRDQEIQWAVGRWRAEVENRPLRNVHRRSLDDSWRQVIRHFGGDPEALCGPAHDELLEFSAREGRTDG